MENTDVMQEITTASEEAQETAKTFTQEEVNRIVQDRLSKEKSKHSDYEQLKEKAAKFDEMEEASKSELQKATERAEELEKKLADITLANEIRAIKDKVSSESGVPASLLTGATEEECRAQAEAINAFAKPNYPIVKDGGEVHSPSTITKADILAIKDEKARIKAIQEHIDLF